MASTEPAPEPTSGTSPEPRLGPLVHRAVHHGAALWLVAALQFILVMVIVQFAWTGHPGYNLSTDYISDLGNTHCGPWPHADSRDICSPLHDLFNASIVVMGLLVILGAFLIRTGFPARRSSSLGLALIAIGGIGAAGVGFSPENVNITVHSASALIAFAIGNLSLVVLGFAMFRDTRWNGLRAYSIFSGLIGLIATLLFVRGAYVGLGVGGMERLVVAPQLLWLIVVSVHLLRIRQYAPHALPAPGH